MVEMNRRTGVIAHASERKRTRWKKLEPLLNGTSERRETILPKNKDI